MARSQRGQAAVESALTLPLVVFLFLGMLQLFLLAQGRILTQLGAARATRVGSTNHGHCGRMVHAALLTVLPAIESYLGQAGGTPGDKLAAAFAKRSLNAYNERYSDGGASNPYTGSIVWVARERPLMADVQGLGAQDVDFDTVPVPMRLETRLIFWFPLRVPFANWVMSRMWLAQYGLQRYTAQNPLLLTQQAGWRANASGYRLDAAIAQEVLTRADRREYVFPVEASYTMRMMSPAKASNFATQHCPPTPAGLL